MKIDAVPAQRYKQKTRCKAHQQVHPPATSRVLGTGEEKKKILGLKSKVELPTAGSCRSITQGQQATYRQGLKSGHK